MPPAVVLFVTLNFRVIRQGHAFGSSLTAVNYFVCLLNLRQSPRLWGSNRPHGYDFICNLVKYGDKEISLRDFS